MRDHRVTLAQIKAAHGAFIANEPRDLFYQAATELVDLALKKKTKSLTVAEALSVLLQTWNRAYYQYRPFDAAHLEEIETLLQRHGARLRAYRLATIDALDTTDDDVRETVSSLFKAFENVLGPVGAAKALHLLAPRFFPLWDRKIAKEYGLALTRTGTNGNKFWDFMKIAQHQTRGLRDRGNSCPNALKSIDEYNYCEYVKRWPF